MQGGASENGTEWCGVLCPDWLRVEYDSVCLCVYRKIQLRSREGWLVWVLRSRGQSGQDRIRICICIRKRVISTCYEISNAIVESKSYLLMTAFNKYLFIQTPHIWPSHQGCDKVGQRYYCLE